MPDIEPQLRPRHVAVAMDGNGPDVDLFLRPSGEQRTSNFLVWQLAFAEMVFMDVLWPDFERRHLWQAAETYAARKIRIARQIPM